MSCVLKFPWSVKRIERFSFSFIVVRKKRSTAQQKQKGRKFSGASDYSKAEKRRRKKVLFPLGIRVSPSQNLLFRSIERRRETFLNHLKRFKIFTVQVSSLKCKVNCQDEH